MSEMYSDKDHGWVDTTGGGSIQAYGFNRSNTVAGDTPTEQTCTIVHLVEPGEVGKVATSAPRFRRAYLASNPDGLVTVNTSGQPEFSTPSVDIGWVNFNSTVYRR